MAEEEANEDCFLYVIRSLKLLCSEYEVDEGDPGTKRWWVKDECLHDVRVMLGVVWEIVYHTGLRVWAQRQINWKLSQFKKKIIWRNWNLINDFIGKMCVLFFRIFELLLKTQNKLNIKRNKSVQENFNICLFLQIVKDEWCQQDCEGSIFSNLAYSEILIGSSRWYVLTHWLTIYKMEHVSSSIIFKKVVYKPKLFKMHGSMVKMQ